MKKYSTAEKMSITWNITVRHVQYLCRTGKIKGAVKRAGAWLIPDDIPIPVKNSKSNVRGFNFIGTKGKIFNKALKLFIQDGYNSVSITDIAAEVGIKQSSIYHHFKSKQEILDTIYDFYCHYYLKERMPLEEMRERLKTDSLLEILNHIKYIFKEDYAQKLFDITRLVFQRISIDERANKIGSELMIDEGMKYVEDVFKMGIEMGRFAPFDTKGVAFYINSTRFFTMYNWLIDPSLERLGEVDELEQVQYRYLCQIITEINPPKHSF